MNNTSSWDRMPEALQNAIQSAYHDKTDLAKKDAIRMLIEYALPPVTASVPDIVDELDIVRWIDTFFADVLCTSIVDHEEWVTQRAALSLLLQFSKQRLIRYAKEHGISLEHRTEDAETNEIVRLFQDLHLFEFARAYSNENPDRIREKGKACASDSLKNLTYLLSREDAQTLYDRDLHTIDDGFYIQGMASWREPMVWLANTALYEPDGGYVRLFTFLQIYAEYLQKLRQIERLTANEAIHNEIYQDEYDNFAKLADIADWWIEDAIGELEDDLAKAEADKDLLEDLVNAAGSPLARMCIDKTAWHDPEDPPEPGEFLTIKEEAPESFADSISAGQELYHRTWEAFSNQLRTLISENPDTPIVLSDGLSERPVYGVTPWCRIGYVYDGDGRCREKILQVGYQYDVPF